MATTKTCDGCGKPITEDNPIVLKLFSAPVKKGETRSTHSYYNRHMDIGQCCVVKVNGLGKWQKRQTRKEYNNGRRHRPADTLAASQHDQASAA